MMFSSKFVKKTEKIQEKKSQKTLTWRDLVRIHQKLVLSEKVHDQKRRVQELRELDYRGVLQEKIIRKNMEFSIFSYLFFEKITVDFLDISSHQAENPRKNVEKTVVEFYRVFYKLRKKTVFSIKKI